MVRALFFCFLAAASLFAESLTVATYNLEFYVDTLTMGNEPKSPEGRKRVREAIRHMDPDVIAFQEVGSTNALLELRAALKLEGLDFPHWEFVRGWDQSLRLAFLSKLPIRARRPHVSDSFLHQGRRFHVTRGFGEIEIEAGRGNRVTVISAHLKSKRRSAEADQEDIRLEEAQLLREKIDAFLQREPAGHLIVLGDFNDGISSPAIRTILGRGRGRLFDTRPDEHNGQGAPSAAPEPARVVWTHYYAKEETYSRMDYIFASPSLGRRFRDAESYVLGLPEWAGASDHRPVRARFEF